MSKLPPNRFVIRPDIDSNDKVAVDQLAGDIADWVIAHRDRVQNEIKLERKDIYA